MDSVLKEVVQNHVNTQEPTLRRIVDELPGNKNIREDKEDVSSETIKLTRRSCELVKESLTKVKKGAVLYESVMSKVKLNDKSNHYSRETREVAAIQTDLVMVAKVTQEVVTLSLRLDLEQGHLLVRCREERAHQVVTKHFLGPWLEQQERREGGDCWRERPRLVLAPRSLPLAKEQEHPVPRSQGVGRVARLALQEVEKQGKGQEERQQEMEKKMVALKLREEEKQKKKEKQERRELEAQEEAKRKEELEEQKQAEQTKKVETQRAIEASLEPQLRTQDPDSLLVWLRRRAEEEAWSEEGLVWGLVRLLAVLAVEEREKVVAMLKVDKKVSFKYELTTENDTDDMAESKEEEANSEIPSIASVVPASGILKSPQLQTPASVEQEVVARYRHYY